MFVAAQWWASSPILSLFCILLPAQKKACARPNSCLRSIIENGSTFYQDLPTGGFGTPLQSFTSKSLFTDTSLVEYFGLPLQPIRPGAASVRISWRRPSWSLWRRWKRPRLSPGRGEERPGWRWWVCTCPSGWVDERSSFSEPNPGGFERSPEWSPSTHPHDTLVWMMADCY